MKLQTKSGFSLVELMVVVAIIGILATVAVPNFQRFQARAKQSSAKTELSGIYTAQKAFFVEYNNFNGDLPAIGFVPEGLAVVTAAWAVNDRTRVYASSSGTPVPADLVSLGLAASVPAFSGAYPAHGNACNGMSGAAATVTALGAAVTHSSTTAASTFTAAAMGCPRDRAQATFDRWTINEARNLVNATSGI